MTKAGDTSGIIIGMNTDQFIEDWHARMSQKEYVGPQGAVNLKHDAWLVVIRHILIEKGVTTAEDFDKLLIQQLGDFEKMIDANQIKFQSPIDPRQGN